MYTSGAQTSSCIGITWGPSPEIPIQEAWVGLSCAFLASSPVMPTLSGTVLRTTDAQTLVVKSGDVFIFPYGGCKGNWQCQNSRLYIIFRVYLAIGPCCYPEVPRLLQQTGRVKDNSVSRPQLIPLCHLRSHWSCWKRESQPLTQIGPRLGE